MSVNSGDTIKKIDEKIAQLQSRKKALTNKEKLKQKKENQQRLIKLGKIAEQYSKCKTPEQLEEYFKKQ